jgi:hypothetical protein
MVSGLRDDWLRLTGAGSELPVAISRHYIQRDAAATVVREIKNLTGSLDAR